MMLYNQLLKYIGKNYRDFIFLSLFYSLFIIQKYISFANPELTNFSGRMIGEATLSGYDISKRVSIFYSSGLLFFLLLLLFSIIAWRISLLFKDLLKTPEVRIINYTSLAGIIIYFFSLWNSSVTSSFELIYCIQIVVLIGFCLKKILLKQNVQLLTVSLYSVAFVLGISISFCWNEFSVLFNFLSKANLLCCFTLSLVIGFALINPLIKNKDAIEATRKIKKLVFVLIPLALIPLLSVVKDETYLILNHHQVYFFSPRKLYLIGLLALALFVVWRYRIIKKDSFAKKIKTVNQLVSIRYFALLVLGLSAFTFYEPFLKSSTELFEAGNQLLPLMEFQKFGVLPIIEKFNSHELSELFFGSIYTIFNGLHGREMFIYDFLFQVLWACLVYLFFYKLSRNAYISLFLVLLFPLIQSLLSDYHIITLIAIFVLHRLINEKASFKNYMLLFSCAAFLLLWRIDIGYPASIAMVGTLFIYWLNQKRFVFDKKIVIRSILLFFTSTLLLLVVIALWRNINILNSISNVLNYLSSAQSYGHVELGDSSSSLFKMHYFVFPFLITIGFGSLLIFFQRYTISKSQRFIYTSLIFFSIYYFVNFQRGLVRHSFMEGHDEGLSSFLFLILSSSIFLVFHNRSQLFKFIVFIGVSTLLIMNYKFPVIMEPQNIYSATVNKMAKMPFIIPKENITRTIDTTDFGNANFGNFKKLISKYLSENQTFIDFSNTPLLYYYAGKVSPSYFYQNPLTIQNDLLQKNFISNLQKYDAPLLVFSNFPENYWDNVDGVPNELRHYRLSEYFYTHYQPFAIVDNLSIWKRTNFLIKNEQRLMYTFTEEVWDSININSSLQGIAKNFHNKNYLFKISSDKLKSKVAQLPSVKIIQGNKILNLKPNLVDNNTGYYIYNTSEGGFSFQIKNEGRTINEVKFYECDFIPDFSSTVATSFNMGTLPYIWGTFDKLVHQDGVLAELIVKPVDLKKNNPLISNLKMPLDKSSGNTVLISLECNNDNPFEIELEYGDSNHKEVKGTFLFTIPAGKRVREFAIRVSSQYNWYSMIDYIALSTENVEDITINKLQLLRGE